MELHRTQFSREIGTRLLSELHKEYARQQSRKDQADTDQIPVEQLTARYFHVPKLSVRSTLLSMLLFLLLEQYHRSMRLVCQCFSLHERCAEWLTEVHLYLHAAVAEDMSQMPEQGIMMVV